MKRLAFILLALGMVGCARPGEIGYGTVDTPGEQYSEIARNWDWDGKQLVDDTEMALLIRPMGHLTRWNLR